MMDGHWGLGKAAMAARPLSFGCLNMRWEVERQLHCASNNRIWYFLFAREFDGKVGKIGDLCPCHLACFFLPSRLWVHHSPLWTLKSLIWCLDIFLRTHGSLSIQRELYILGQPSLFWLPSQVPVVWPFLHHNFLPLVIHKMSALLDFTGPALLMEAATTLSPSWKPHLLNHTVLIGHGLNRLSLHIQSIHCWRGKAAMAARPPSCIIHINHHKCLSGKASMAERPPLAPTYFLSFTLSTFCPLYLLGRPAAIIHKKFRSKVISLSSGSPPVAAMDRSKVISLSLLFPDGLLQWKDPKWSPWSKFVEES